MRNQDDVLVLSITDVLTGDDCPRQLFFRKYERLVNEVQNISLKFGTLLHSMADQIIVHLHDNPHQTASFDIDGIFDQGWENTIKGHALSYPANHTQQDMYDIGLALARRFYGLWPELGYFPLTDQDSRPVQSKMLEADLGENVILRGKLDFQGYGPDASFDIIDFKFPRSAHSESFCYGADQLTGYQLLSDTNRDLLESPLVDRLGFMDGLKRKVPVKGSRGKGPDVNAPLMMERRSVGEVRSFRDKVLWMADDIRRGRFPKRSRQAHNTPCDMCDYSRLCQFGDMTGLESRKKC